MSTSNALKERARELRRNQTDAENLLWQILRNREFLGYKFKRQHVIEPFIVDFICLEYKVIIELDGSQHASQKEEDRLRTEFLASRGFKVLRFWNNQVLQETEAVAQVIIYALKERKGAVAPSP